MVNILDYIRNSHFPCPGCSSGNLEKRYNRNHTSSYYYCNVCGYMDLSGMFG